MSVGEGDGGKVMIPPDLEILEMDVEMPLPEVERSHRGNDVEPMPPRPLSPRFRYDIPFKTARGFGNWLHHQLDPESFRIITFKFIRYYQNNNVRNVRNLVRFGKFKFRKADRLYFYQGLHIVAASMKQKDYIRKVFGRERAKIERRLTEALLSQPITSAK